MQSQETQSVSKLSPTSDQSVVGKHELRDLNTRLEMYVRNQQQRTQEVDNLKKQLEIQQNQWEKKLKDQEKAYYYEMQKLRVESEKTNLQNKGLSEEIENISKKKSELETRIEAILLRASECDARLQSITRENNSLKNEINQLRNSYATSKYKFESFENEKTALLNQVESLKDKNNVLMKDLNKKTLELKSQEETFSRLLVEKSKEIDKLKDTKTELEKAKEEYHTKLRNEFDEKLKEFVEKREEQYKQEKDEWTKIFKEEFNRKIRTYKEVNIELEHRNKKYEEELQEKEQRITQIKKLKTELEVTNKNLEEEIEISRKDLDEMRRSKDEDSKIKNTQISQLKENYKRKEIEYDELMHVKIQLGQEIDLYRKILIEAEKLAGYKSPLASTKKKKKIK